MYWYMYRTCIGRDPTVQYLKKLSEITFSESHILPSSPDLRPVCTGVRCTVRPYMYTSTVLELITAIADCPDCKNYKFY